uniref:Cytochrome c biogenesis protein Ccs1 n=1 Tax=Caulacanthus okamurae TaxID=152008 RepID=A0A6H1U6X0_9FLOR|nr:c-type cytochrome biogenesis protein [Caulacanthus okamurae]QIZ74594.1 c-type cytochrome biogenesis protein [Caulacanthus okamurae]
MKYSHYKSLQWEFIKKLSNLNFSILLLLIIACTSILGTIIEQDKDIQYYQINYPINHHFLNYINWKNITLFGLDHIYATWWFICLLALFFCSLLTCTFSRQLPSLRNARVWKFTPHNNSYKQYTKVKLLSDISYINITYILNLQKYYVFQKDIRIYGYKGLIGRIAPIFVHISLIITLSGSMIGFFSGFTAQEMIPNQEIFHVQNTINSGLYSHLPQNILGKIDNFLIEYNKDNSIKQFYSHLTLINNKGQYVIDKVISVNSPLKFKGLTFYQTSWSINAIKIQLDRKIVQQGLTETILNNKRVWIYNLNIQSSKQLSFIINGLNNQIYVYNSSGNLIQKLNIGEKLIINNHELVINELMTSTGIQIKTDPGIYIVYTGFLILMISITISYLSYCEIWINHNKNNVNMAGLTNRGELTFEEELIQIHKKFLQTQLNE